MRYGFGEKKIIFPLVIVLLSGSLYVIWGAIGPPSHKKQVTTVREAIPEAIQFYEDNIDFFDLLIDIKMRIVEFNGEGETAPSGLENYHFGKVTEYLTITVKEGSAIFDFKLTGYSNLLTPDERALIEKTLLQLEDEYWRGVTYVTSKFVSVNYFNYHRASLEILNPAEEFEEGDKDDNSNRYYEYAKIISDDWCVYIFKGIYE